MNRASLSTLVTAVALLFSAQAGAAEWQFLPIMNAGFHLDPVLSVTAGEMNVTGGGGSSAAAGIEAAFNCLLVQPPVGSIRTKLSLNEYDHDGQKLRTLELNPRWTRALTRELSVGVGPGLGWVHAEAGGRTTNLAALQLGADLDYRIGALNLGLAARWQDTAKKDLGMGGTGANNFLVQAKMGVAF